MQLKEPKNDPLEEAIATIVSEAPPQGLYTRCLDKARFLDLPGESIKTQRVVRRKVWPKAFAAIAAVVLVSVTLPSFFHSGVAIAQIESSLAAIKFLRVEIIDPQSKE